jgi:hypothetical protein
MDTQQMMTHAWVRVAGVQMLAVSAALIVSMLLFGCHHCRFKKYMFVITDVLFPTTALE